MSAIIVAQRLAAVSLLVLWLGVAGLAGGCNSPVDVGAARASEIARDYVDLGQPVDAEILELTVRPPQRVGNVWRVEVDLLVVLPPPSSNQPVPLHYLIDVDVVSGKPSIFAQG